jgi:hypothetical protein
MAKLSTLEMRDLFRDSPVRVGEIYQHYKGGIYVVTCLTLDTDTGNLRVSYARIGGPNFDAVAENGITFSRRIEEWTPDRFIPYVGNAII